jgi:murein DD-endopeptidase MepM/ murein hydrolase activator NlpD
MAQSVLSSLLYCSVWSALICCLAHWLLQRIPALRPWPTFYWLCLLLCFLPLLPLPELGQRWLIPSVLLQDAVYTMQTLIAQPAHPGVTLPALHLEQLWPLVLSAVLLISLWQLGRVAWQWRQLQQLIQLATPLPMAALFSTQQRAQLPPGFSLRQTALAVSPFVAGWQHMVLVVPAYIWQLSAAQRELLLAHELAHLQRRDAQQLLLLRVLAAFCWFMPALRYLEQGFARSIELAADQAVLRTQPKQAALYGQTLLRSLKLSQSPQASALSAGFIHGAYDKGFYQQRLGALFQCQPVMPAWRRWRTGLLFGAAVLAIQLGSSTLSFQAPAQTWLLPVDNVSVSSFFAERHPIRQNRPHQGIDFAAETGVIIQASQHGKVLIADDSSLNSRYGKVVLIDHGGGFQTLYAHLDSYHVRPGQRVQAGEPIATVGETGNVTGPHLHFEILLNGQQQDPASYLSL